MEKYSLYKKKNDFTADSDFDYKILIFTPSLKKPFFWKKHYIFSGGGRSLTRKMKLRDTMWAFASLFRYKVYYVLDGNRIVHMSYCIYRCFKFPFIKKGQVQIGPCDTDESYRGLGYYKTTISYICENEGVQDFFMIIRDANTISIEAVKKVGFERIADLVKSKLLKIYKIDKGDNDEI